MEIKIILNQIYKTLKVLSNRMNLEYDVIWTKIIQQRQMENKSKYHWEHKKYIGLPKRMNLIVYKQRSKRILLQEHKKNSNNYNKKFSTVKKSDSYRATWVIKET